MYFKKISDRKRISKKWVLECDHLKMYFINKNMQGRHLYQVLFPYYLDTYSEIFSYRQKNGNSPFRNIAPYGAIRRIFKLDFYRLF